MIVTEDVYKDKPIIVLKRSEDEKYPFSFGLAKAKSIMECYDDIKAFVEKHEKPEETAE